MSQTDQASLTTDDGSQQLLPLAATHPASSAVHSFTHTYTPRPACMVLCHAACCHTCLPFESGSCSLTNSCRLLQTKVLGSRHASTTKLSNAGNERPSTVLDIVAVVVLVNLQLFGALACCCRLRCWAAGVLAQPS